MKILTLIVEPDLKTISASITICWLLMIAHLFWVSAKETQVILLLTWLFLFSGFLAKVKGFKISNGIFSILLFGLSVFWIAHFANSVIESGVTSPQRLPYIIPQLIILIMSAYNTYFTLKNKHFNVLYNYKLDVSKNQKMFFKISTILFILVIGIYTFLDLINLGLL